jgi:ankyrin repeat protein
MRLAGLFLGGVLAVSAATLGSSALIEAAKGNNLQGVKQALAQKADVNAAEADGTTALHWAAHWGDASAIELLLKAGANVRAANRYGVTPLSEAVTNGDGTLIKRLLDAGADPNTLTTDENETVLMQASRTGNVQGVKALLDAGAMVNTKESFRGQTALMWAAAEGHADVLKLLLAKGADLKLRSFDRSTQGPKLPAGSPVAPIPRGGLTALHFAVRQGEAESAKILLEAGAEINGTDPDGNTPLLLALLNSHFDTAAMLIERGADVNLGNKDGRAPLYMAIDVHDADYSPRPARRMSDKMTSLEAIQLLLAKGADVNGKLKNFTVIDKFAQDHGDKTLGDGATPFLRAARSSDIEVMKLLLAKGADPKVAQKDGLNALLLTAGVGWSEKIKGTDEQSVEAARYLLSLGLNINATTEKGETTMHGAALRGNDAMIKFLAANGAKLNLQNKAGFIPLDYTTGKAGYQGGGAGNLRDPKPSTEAAIREAMAKYPAQIVADADQPKLDAPKPAAPAVITQSGIAK